jgi:acyl-CoA thioesterase
MTLDESTRYFAILRDAFHEAPITKFVRQTMEIPGPGTVTITLHPDPRHHHGAARVHGGVLGLVLDNAGFFACATMTDGYWVATAEYKVNLLETVADEEVVATGRVLRKGRHLVHAEMEATSAAGVKVAVGLGTYLVLPRKFRGA